MLRGLYCRFPHRSVRIHLLSMLRLTVVSLALAYDPGRAFLLRFLSRIRLAQHALRILLLLQHLPKQCSRSSSLYIRDIARASALAACLQPMYLPSVLLARALAMPRIQGNMAQAAALAVPFCLLSGFGFGWLSMPCASSSSCNICLSNAENRSGTLLASLPRALAPTAGPQPICPPCAALAFAACTQAPRAMLRLETCLADREERACRFIGPGVRRVMMGGIRARAQAPVQRDLEQAKGVSTVFCRWIPHAQAWAFWFGVAMIFEAGLYSYACP